MAAPVNPNVMLPFKVLLMIALLASLVACATDTQTYSDERGLSPSEWPESCTEAVEYLLEGLSDEDKATIRNTPKENLINFHFGWGMGIRNELGLWRGNDQLISSCMDLNSTNDPHPDSISMIIIEEVWKALNEQ